MSTDKIFDEAFELLMKLEGETYTEIDGSPTKYGISQRTFPSIDIKNLTKKEAKKIYRYYFWLLVCDKVARVSAELGVVYFTVIVHMGYRMAGRCLQDAINGLNKLYRRKEIAVDGIVGPITMSFIKIYGERLIPSLLAEVTKRYIFFANSTKKNRRFLHGWLHRSMRVLIWYWRRNGAGEQV